ncbi:MAG: gpi mannosyltransferase 4 [Lasallia pustulata]|uniref:Mannosyltransferase n=1 Tax=Lasallia pustulata TaxID=136370 RepID=A0A5M8PRT6_9LECA|nr:MAG: gpi mannosyltransferase 4 [Lasallia pustulata]
MWRRTYLLLILVRLYFALSPSYIHPDENFQGPEVIAGKLFSFPHHLTWDFTSSKPIRSVFPLWPVYGVPMIVLRWVWTESGKEQVAPQTVYYTLRALMFILSFVLEDWAIHELVPSPRQRTAAVVLVASSYVTWTYQTHTFSNSIETLAVLWSLVLIQRILENKQRSSIFSSALLGVLSIFGIFNRITLPAFLLLPGLYLIPHLIRKPLSLLALLLSALLTTLTAITTDTLFYHPSPLSLHTLPRSKPLFRHFLGAWIVFNAALGVLMGVYHQGGVVPMQIWLGQQQRGRGALEGVSAVLWWRTYSPPVWLIDGNGGEGGLQTVDLMGVAVEEVMRVLERSVGGCGKGQEGKGVVLVAPRSSVELDRWTGADGAGEWVFEELWFYRRHLNLDDLDFGGDGVRATVKRVVGRRGLMAWKIKSNCNI